MNKQENRQLFYRFVFFSATAGLLQAGVFALLFDVFTWRYWLAYLLSLLTLVLWNTTFNRKYTFRSSVKYHVAVLKLGLFYVFFVPLSTWGGNHLVDRGWNGYLVLVISMIVNLLLAFFYNKYYIYHHQINQQII